MVQLETVSLLRCICTNNRDEHLLKLTTNNTAAQLLQQKDC